MSWRSLAHQQIIRSRPPWFAVGPIMFWAGAVLSGARIKDPPALCYALAIGFPYSYSNISSNINRLR